MLNDNIIEFYLKYIRARLVKKEEWVGNIVSSIWKFSNLMWTLQARQSFRVQHVLLSKADGEAAFDLNIE